MELRQIMYFIEVAEREHMTDAANALHVAQSAISRQIVNLENELGVKLFIREGRNVRLTPIGHIFLEHMRNAVNALEYAKQVMDEYVDPERGTIHIGFTSSLASYILPTSISVFRKEHPNVKFQFFQGTYYELEEKIIKGDINIALMGPVPQASKRIKSSILFTEKMDALIPRNHKLASFPSIRLTDLRDETFVLFPKGFILRDIITNACQQLGFEPNVSFEGEEMTAIKGLVSAGLGISLIPEFTLVDNIPRATVRIPVREPAVTRTIGTVISSERPLLPTEELFYNFLHHFYTNLGKYQ